ALVAEREERRLERVLGVGAMEEQTQAQSQDHGAVPPQQALESRLVASQDEAFQELGVAYLPAVPPDGVHQAVDQRLELSVAHERPSLPPSLTVEPGAWPGCTLFSERAWLRAKRLIRPGRAAGRPGGAPAVGPAAPPHPGIPS